MELLDVALKIYRYLGAAGAIAVASVLLLGGIVMSKLGLVNVILGKEPNGERRVRKHLYNEDGTTKFITRPECWANRNACNQAVCTELGEIKTQIEGIQESGRDDAKERSEELQKISKFMGGVEQFMKHVSEEMRDLKKRGP